jgi:hypothetical protein
VAGDTRDTRPRQPLLLTLARHVTSCVLELTEIRLSVPEAADRSADGPALAPRRTAKRPETTGTDPNANPQVAVQIR